MFCPNCGSELKDNNDLCLNCGWRRETAENEVITKKQIPIKAILSVVIIIIILIIIYIVYIFTPPHFKNDGIGDYYKKSDGTYATNEWVKIKNNWYFFNQGGYLVKDSLTSDGYYVDEKGKMIKDNWKQLNGLYFYFGKNGEMTKNNWVEDDGKWYYLNNDGVMLKNAWVDGEYYVNENGEMLANESKEINGIKYYFDNKGIIKRNVENITGKYSNYEKDILNFLNGKSKKNMHEDTIKIYEYAYTDDGKNVKITLLMNDYIKYITTLAIEKYEGKESGIEKKEKVTGSAGGPGLSGIDYSNTYEFPRKKNQVKDGFDIEVVKDRYKSRGFNKEEMELVEKGEFSEKFKEEILKDKRIEYEDGEYWIKGLTEEMVIALPHHLNMEDGETILYTMSCIPRKTMKKVIEGKKFTKCEIIDYGNKSRIMGVIIYQDDNKIETTMRIENGKIYLSLIEPISSPKISIEIFDPETKREEVYENVNGGYGTEEENEWVYEQNRKGREQLAKIDKEMREETPEIILMGQLRGVLEEFELYSALMSLDEVKEMTKRWGRYEITLDEFREEFKEYVINGLNENVKKKYSKEINKYLETVNRKE